MSRKMLDHWASVIDTHASISEFLEWAEARGHIRIYTLGGIVDEFLEVDRRQLDREREALLATARGGT